MKTSVSWPVLVCGLAVVALGSEQKPAPKQGVPPGGTPSQIGLPYPHKYNISPEQKERKNPVRFTDLSVDRGKKLFLNHCAMCHGNSGDGKGELVPVFDVHPPDFTKPGALDKRTDGELFAIIGQGSEKMPSHRTLLEEKQVWDVVNFLRMVGGRVPEKATVDDRKTATVPAISD